MIPAAIEQAISVTKNKKIGVIATQATIDSHIYKKEFAKKGFEVFEQACPKLAPMIEKGEDISLILREYIAPLLSKGIDTLILGCTHYYFIKDQVLTNGLGAPKDSPIQ